MRFTKIIIIFSSANFPPNYFGRLTRETLVKQCLPINKSNQEEWAFLSAHFRLPYCEKLVWKSLPPRPLAPLLGQGTSQTTARTLRFTWLVGIFLNVFPPTYAARLDSTRLQMSRARWLRSVVVLPLSSVVGCHTKGAYNNCSCVPSLRGKCDNWLGREGARKI